MVCIFSWTASRPRQQKPDIFIAAMFSVSLIRMISTSGKPALEEGNGGKAPRKRAKQ